MKPEEAEWIIRDCRVLIDQARRVFESQQLALQDLRKLQEQCEHLTQMTHRFAVGEKP
jgi:hypothetical protein